MHISSCNDVKAKSVTEPGAKGVSIRVLIDENMGARTFAMRRLEVAPGGETPYHAHLREHEVYVLSGTGKVRSKNGETGMKEGVFVYVAPEEEHNFVNAGTVPLIFLCMIPVAKFRGRKT
jgi:quercetin dioxygenase-like cupin family protein